MTLPEELRMVSNMIHNGEKIQYGRETALMDVAADEIERLQAEAATQLDHCDVCNQMTNHQNDKCLKHKAAVVGDWEESLQVEVLDDYLRLANSKYYIKEEDISGYMEEMRNHYKKLVAFIANLLAAKDREVARASARKEREKVEQVYSELEEGK